MLTCVVDSSSLLSAIASGLRTKDRRSIYSKARRAYCTSQSQPGSLPPQYQPLVRRVFLPTPPSKHEALPAIPHLPLIRSPPPSPLHQRRGVHEMQCRRPLLGRRSSRDDVGHAQLGLRRQLARDKSHPVRRCASTTGTVSTAGGTTATIRIRKPAG
jgi:hypothetical protein